MARKDRDRDSDEGLDNGGEPLPLRGKRPTREDLLKATEAAREAVHSADVVLEQVTAGLGQHPGDMGVTPIKPGGDQAQGQRAPGGQQQSGPPAFEAFMASLDQAIKRAGADVHVNENAGWVKIESQRNGHKIYIAKTKTTVNRIESTLPAAQIRGAEAVEPGSNGRIASMLPADTEVVSQAIALLARMDEHIPPPRRGPQQQGGGGQGQAR